MGFKKFALILSILVVTFAAACKPDAKLLQRIDDAKAKALAAKVQAESVKASVSFKSQFQTGETAFADAVKAFEKEAYEDSLSKYEAAYDAYQSSYDKAKSAMERAKAAMQNADRAIETATDTVLNAEAEDSQAADA